MPYSFRLLFLLIGLLSSCRSQQSPFRFEPQRLLQRADAGATSPDADFSSAFEPQAEVRATTHVLARGSNFSVPPHGALRTAGQARSSRVVKSSPASGFVGRQVKQALKLDSRLLPHSPGPRSAAPVLVLGRLGVLGLLIGAWIGTLETIALSFLTGLGFVVLALMLFGRTIWPKGAAQALTPGRGIRVGTWLEILGWVLGISGIGLGLMLGGWLGLLVALVLVAAGMFVGLFGSLSNDNLP